MERDAQVSSHRHGPFFWILALALLVRAVPIGAGLPYLGYIDEGHVLHPVIRLLRTNGWDPGWYLHPSLTLYLITGLTDLARPAYRMIHGRSLALDLPAQDAYPADTTFYDFVSPPEVILLGRLLIVVLSVATVALVWALARRLGGRREAILASLLAALCPALVTRASIVIIDSVATFFALATLYFAHRLEGTSGNGSPPGAAGLADTARRDSVLAGACAGCAFTAKYTIGLVSLAVAFVILTRPGRLRDRLRLLLSAAGAAICAAAVTMPALVFRTRAVVTAILEQSRLYAHPSQFTFDFSPGGPGYFRQAIRSLELGLPLSVAGILGLAWMLTRRRTRKTAMGWLLFGGLLLFALFLHPFQAFRNVLPLVPLLCIGAALPVAGELPPATLRGWLKTLAALLVIASLAAPLVRWLPERTRLVDSRTLLVNWLSVHARPGQNVLVLADLAVLPTELMKIPAHVRTVRWSEALDALRSGRFDYVVTGRIDLSGPSDPALGPYRRRWDDAMSRLTPEVSFGEQPTPVFPNYWRGNGELITILRASDTLPRQEPRS